MRYNRIKLTTLSILLVWHFLFCGKVNASGHVYQNFDSLPATAGFEIPRSGGTWRYTSNRTNSRDDIKNCGWYNTKGYQTHPKVFDFFKYYRNTYNTPHMGFETYGFLEIDGSTAVKGNSLKVIATGGRYSDGEEGKPVFCKEEYLELLKNGGHRGKGDVKVGHPYIYFCNNSSSKNPIAFPYATGCNRLSLYIRMPKSVDNGSGGKGNPPLGTIHLGPYNGVGGHWYHQYYNRGGGWTHLLVDGHPQHNNAWHNEASYPYPSRSLRDMDTVYFSTMYRWYITFLPYSGIAVPPYKVWIDEVEFYHDDEPQNSETINSPAITFHPESKLFEIGFNDKYKNNGNSRSTYEVRYSFSPITNRNFDSAQCVSIEPDPRFGIAQNGRGVFNKWWPYCQTVWAPFRLRRGDEQNLKPGTRIFFAVRDLSDRPYHLGTFDREGDMAMVVGMPGKRRLDLIKRIDFIIDKNYSPVDARAEKVPEKVRNLKAN